ncbi:MAG TPA: lysophospholipid acyltransferase family protein [Candidatus Rifleibacterium sp.]|nr:lysophospholipid acyltransferase family protein [Candidatus Rifleibacterium sp.]HPW59518.1 lysophospholipid acyltransferase family protein [Candidatus Rifleibacterium sp.]
MIRAMQQPEIAIAAASQIRPARSAAASAGLRLKAMLLSGLVSSLHSLVRIKHTGFVDFVERRKIDRPVLVASWHGTLLVPLYCLRGLKLVIMSSLSDDGEIMVKVLKHFGYCSVRGSSSRGGMRGLLEMVKMVKGGMNAALTVDGPRGPRHEVKPGMVMIAQKSGGYILPVGVACSHKLTVNSWDKTEIPLPFSRVVMHSGRPFVIDAATSVEEGCEMIRQSLFESNRQAEIYLKSGNTCEV